MNEYDAYDHPVDGHCPACGSEDLYLSLGRPTCFKRGCPAPDTAAKILEDPEIHHIVRFDGQGQFMVQHPLRERIDGALFGCWIHGLIADMGDIPREGTWRLVTVAAIPFPDPGQDADYQWEQL